LFIRLNAFIDLKHELERYSAIGLGIKPRDPMGTREQIEPGNFPESYSLAHAAKAWRLGF
jgi:hypothetical protein